MMNYFVCLLLAAILAFVQADYGNDYDSYASDYNGHNRHGNAHHHYGLPAHTIVTRKNPKKVFLYADEGYYNKGHNYGFFQGDEIGYTGSGITNNLGHSVSDDKHSNDKYQHYTLTGSKGDHHGDNVYYPKDNLYVKGGYHADDNEYY